MINDQLKDIAYTLQVGREAMDARLAVVATDVGDLMDKLTRLREGERDVENLYRGDLGKLRTGPEVLIDGEEGREYLRLLIRNQKLDKLARLWVSGVNVDWESSHPFPGPRRIPLPTYPFARTRHWIPDSADALPALHSPTPDPPSPQPSSPPPIHSSGPPSIPSSIHPTAGAGRSSSDGPFLHPLVHRDASNGGDRKFTTRLTGDEFYLADHVVDGRSVLPGVAFLEMALAAGGMVREGWARKVKNIIWARPVSLNGGPREIYIRLRSNGSMLDYAVGAMDDPDPDVPRARGRLVFEEKSPDRPNRPAVDISAIKKRCGSKTDGRDCYERFRANGLEYGPGFQPIKELFRGDGEALSRLELPPGLQTGFGEFHLHPTLMDGALQSVIGLAAEGDASPDHLYLPFAMGEVEILSSPTPSCYAYIARAGGKSSAAAPKFDIDLMDDAGLPLVKMKGFALRAVKPPAGPSTPSPGPGKPEVVRYREKWEPAGASPDPAPVRGSVLLLDLGTEARERLEALAGADGDLQAVLVRPGDAFRMVSDDIFEVNPGRGEDWSRLVEALAETGRTPERILHAWAMGGDPGEGAEPDAQLGRGIHSLFHLTRELMKQGPTHKTRLLYLHPEDDETALPLNEAVSGFARTIRMERPGFLYKTVGVGRGVDMALSWREFSEDEEVEVRLDGKSRWVRRIVEAPPTGGPGSGSPLRPGAVYLITGGAGGLGLLFAAHLAEKTGARTALSGRSSLGEKQEAKLEEIRASGADIHYFRADVSRAGEAATLVEKVKERFGAINGVIHAAGVLRDSYVINKKIEDLEAVLAPKVHGALNLDAATREEPLDLFVMFSSAASVSGNPGQGDYAYANRFMDGFAELRDKRVKRGERSGKTLSINWPLWREGGMRVDEAVRALLEKKAGVVPLEAVDGIRAFHEALTARSPRVIVKFGHREKMNRVLGVRTGSAGPRPPAAGAPGAAGASEEATVEQVEMELIRICAALLKVDPGELETDAPLEEYGMDSIMMMALLTAIEDRFGCDVDPSAIAENPEIGRLARYLVTEGVVKAAGGSARESAPRTEGVPPVPGASAAPEIPVAPGAGASGEATVEMVERELIRICASLLKVPPGELETDAPLEEYGMDSIMMMSLLTAIEDRFGCDVDPSAIAENPEIGLLARHLLAEGVVMEEMEEKPGSAPRADAAPPAPESIGPVRAATPARTLPGGVNGKIAVIGVACRFPGSPDVEAFWENLKNGRDLITETPERRWKIDDYYSPDRDAPGRTYSKWGGWIDGVEFFDAGFFGVSDEKAMLMDPQHRILLEQAQVMFDGAGLSREALDHTRTGVFIGGSTGSYLAGHAERIPEESVKHAIVNSIQNMMASRISDFYNFKGPSQITDTACSSSLVAIHQARRSIENGECDMAVAGGIELLLDPMAYVWFSKAGVLSDEGKAYIFDERAKGIVMGEGVGLVLLKPLERALEEGDPIRAVISGSAVNNDGRTMGLTVPDKEGQKEVVRQALAESGVHPETITLLEAHGTGTLLGDPIEIRAATQVHREFTRAKNYCAVGSVKSNIGHLMHAAGVASFIKAVCALENRRTPPTLHCERPHPRFGFENSPFYPAARLEKWIPKNFPRRAGVSSFGFGGTNSHVIVEEFAGGESRAPKRAPLPPTRFERKRYWLGEPIVPASETGRDDSWKKQYRDLFEKLSRGELTLDRSIEMSLELEQTS